MKPEMKKCWKKAYEMGIEYAKRFDYPREAYSEMSMDELSWLCNNDGCGEFFEAGFNSREPEWVEAYRFGELPTTYRSINWVEHKWEPGISCVCIIRDEETAKKDAENTLYAMLGRDLIRVGGWWLGLSGSDGEPTLLGCVKIA